MVNKGKILVVNDHQPTSRFLREKLIVDAGYAVHFESTSYAGLEALRQNSFDIVVAKFGMSDLNGKELIQGFKKIDPDCIIIVSIEEDSPQLQKEISQLGVYDYLTQPINAEKLFFLIKKGIDLRLSVVAYHKLIESLKEQNISLQRQNVLLAKRINESTRNLTRLYEDLRSTYMRTIKVLAQAIDARDHYTHSHSDNVARYATAIAEEMRLAVREIEMLREACELHDLGKIGIEDSVLGKTSSLTAQEWECIKLHPVKAAEILEPLTFLKGVIDLVRQHHENYDGSGYPEGRQGESILLGARIIHLADAYDAMRSERAYRKAPFSKEEAIQEIKKNSGIQFDPQVVEAFLRVVDEL